MAERKYTFVTVAHQADWDMLRLQARSMRLYLPQDLASEIIVVENSRSILPAEYHDALRGDYGNLAGKVRMFAAPEIAPIPDQTGGWFSQQILKLMVSSEISTDRYVVLDAKNHLVFPLQRTFLESGDRIPAWLTNYEKHSLRPFLERTLSYFGNSAEHIQAFLPAITPFTLPTQMVCDLIRLIVERERKPFAGAFLELGFSEFFLFESYLTALGRVEQIYDLSGIGCPTIWDEHAIRGAGNLKRHIARAERHGLPFFAVHRRAVPWLDDKSHRTLAEFWYRRGLFETVSDGVNLLSTGVHVRPPRARRFYLRWRSRFLGLPSGVRRRLRPGRAKSRPSAAHQPSTF